MTVGGRTSAVIEAVQKLPPGLRQKAKTATKVKAKGRRGKRERSVDSDAEDGVSEEDGDGKDGVEAEVDSKDGLVVPLQVVEQTSSHFKRKREEVVAAAVEEELAPAGRRRSARHREA